jgi:N-carbamoyl-L-amino-acid hydrolase
MRRGAVRARADGLGGVRGRLALETALASRDRAGLVLGEELARIGYRGAAPVGGRSVDYLELHIEQGPRLEETGTVIGVVDRAQHFGGALVTLHRRQQSCAHDRRWGGGATRWRAARCIGEIERIGAALEPHGRVGATTIDAWPNNRVIVPHRAEVGLLIVHADPAARDAALDAIEAAARRIGGGDGAGAWRWTRAGAVPGFAFPAEMVALTEAVAADLGHSSMRLPTWTGHDAFEHALRLPDGAVVPCRAAMGGRTASWSGRSPEHCTAGADMLANMILRAG